MLFFNRPSVAGAVLQTLLCLIHSATKSSFVTMSSKHLQSQTIKARDMKFLEKVHHPLCVIYHMSGVRCHFFLLERKRTMWWSYSFEGLLLAGLPRLVLTKMPIFLYVTF